MKEAGIQPYSISGNDFSEQNGYKEAKLILHQRQKPTAIFALSTTIALGCIKALREEDVRIPEDISLITFDDHPFLEYLATPLTCISQPTREICRTAIKHLFFKLQNKEIREKQVLLKPELKYRRSVRNLL